MSKSSIEELIRASCARIKIPAAEQPEVGNRSNVSLPPTPLPIWASGGSSAKCLAYLIGLYYLDREAIPVGLLIKEAEFLKLYRRGVRKGNVIAVHFALRPLRDPERIAKRAAKIGLREALEEAFAHNPCGAYRPTFVDLLIPLLQEVLEIIDQNMIEGEKSRPAVKRIFREKWRELEAEDLSGSTVADKREFARKVVTKKYEAKAAQHNKTRVTPVFRNPAQVVVGTRRAHTFMDRLLALGKKPSKALDLALREPSHLTDPEDISLRVFSAKVGRDQGKYIYSKVHAGQSRDYPCTQSLPSMLGQAEVMMIIAGSKEMENDVDVLISTIISGLCPDDELRHAQVKRRGETYWLVTKVPTLHAVKHAKNYRSRGSRFWRPIPSRVAKRFQQLRKDKTRFEKALLAIGLRLNDLCQTPPDLKAKATTAKLIQALVIHGEAWLRLPWAVAETAYRSRNGKFPAPRHYVHIGPMLIRKCEPLLRIFDADFRMPKYWPISWGVGSAYCPRTKLVKKLFKHMRTLLKITTRGSVKEIVRKWNALVACCHCLTLIGTGLRNGPIDGIPTRLLRGGIEFIYQKERIFAYEITPPLREILNEVRVVWRKVMLRLQEERIRIRDDQSDRYIYGFLCFETELTYCWTPPSYDMVREGFAGLSSLESYCYWDRNWPRHYSNTLLRELGYNEMAVRTYHGHHDSALDSLRRHRLEPLSLSLRAEMFKSLLRELGYA